VGGVNGPFSEGGERLGLISVNGPFGSTDPAEMMPSPGEKPVRRVKCRAEVAAAWVNGPFGRGGVGRCFASWVELQGLVNGPFGGGIAVGGLDAAR